MKLHADPLLALNTITSYDEVSIEINGQQHYQHSLIVMPKGQVTHWPITRYEELNEHHLLMLIDDRPELILLGCGKQHRLPHPWLLSALAKFQIGIEIMSTHAACRTYNILMAEGRQILAALLIEQDDLEKNNQFKEITE